MGPLGRGVTVGGSKVNDPYGERGNKTCVGFTWFDKCSDKVDANLSDF